MILNRIVILLLTFFTSYELCSGFNFANLSKERFRRNTDDCDYTPDLCVSRLCGLQKRSCTNTYDSIGATQHNSCPAPEIQNGSFEVIERNGKKYVPGGPVPHNAHVNISCNGNYVLNTQVTLLACVHGIWTSDIPECLALCPPLPASTESKKLQCYKNDELEDCKQPIYDAVAVTEYKHNATTNSTFTASICSAGSWLSLFNDSVVEECPARVTSESVKVVCNRKSVGGSCIETQSSCQRFYVPVPGEPLTSTARCVRGSWDRPPLHCQPECGKALKKSKGKRFPWAAGLYRLTKGVYRYTHGVTIIAPNVVITSAHYFASRRSIPENTFFVAAGKYYRDYNITEQFAQTQPVKEIHIPPNYIDIEGNIAVMILKQPLKMTRLVRPVCVDWDGSVERLNYSPDAYGVVEGWGTTTRNGSNSDELIAFNVPQVDRDKCLGNIPVHIHQIVTKERFCAGLINVGTSLCDGFEGNGLALKWTALGKKRYYVRGVGSAIVGDDSQCGDFYNLYTKVSTYAPFIRDIIARSKEVRCPVRHSLATEVRCVLAGRFEDCLETQREGTIAVSRCRPHYMPVGDALTTARCTQGAWSRPLLTCRSTDPLVQACGEASLEGQPFSVNAMDAERGRFPWHVAIYHMENTGLEYRCGGSIIRDTIVLSAAHCFTDGDALKYPAEEFYVGAGKYYREFNSTKDPMAQIRQIKDYHIPEKYLGFSTRYGLDIAVIIVKQPFEFTIVVKPVCIGLDSKIEKSQLQQHNTGIVVGWGSTDPYDPNNLSNTLKQVNLPYINTTACLAQVPEDFKQWIVEDKYCAGYTNGTSVCVGDSGGGMVFKWNDNNVTRYYIRGVVSIGHKDDFLVCDNTKYSLFTKISNHFEFILDVIRRNL